MTKPKSRKPELRPYQSRVLLKVNSGWDDFETQMIEAPCGAGKTVMALLAARKFVEEIAPAKYGVDPSEVGVFWMAMKAEILWQTHLSNQSFHLVSEEEGQLCPNLHFISSFSTRSDEFRGKYKVRLLIADEAHHSASTSELNIVAGLKPHNVLGLSATPTRHDSAVLCFQRTVKDAGYRALIREGYLAQFRHWTVQEYSPESVAATYLADQDRWGQTILFFRTVPECQAAQTALAAGGVECDIVQGGCDRVGFMKRLRSKERRVLISMSILSEGLDYPGLETVFVRDSHSQVNAIQSCGRVLRIDPENPERVKNVVQSTRAPHPFTRQAEAMEQFVCTSDGVWRSVRESPEARRLIRETSRQLGRRLDIPKLPDWEKVHKSLNRSVVVSREDGTMETMTYTTHRDRVEEELLAAIEATASQD